MDAGSITGRCLTLTMKGCAILKKNGIMVHDNTLPSCCESCHEDADRGEGDLCEIVHNSILYMVCCRVSNWWKDNLAETIGAAVG